VAGYSTRPLGAKLGIAGIAPGTTITLLGAPRPLDLAAVTRAAWQRTGRVIAG
jgi:hypothetical protein